MVSGRAKFDEKYERLKLLGEGAYGSAYLVRRKDKKSELEVAKEIRTSHLSEKQREGVLAESKVLAMMKHPNIVGYRESMSEPPKMFIIMEYADGGDLAQKIKERKPDNRRFEEKEIMFIFVQMALALQHIHSRKVLHRDLKPLNVFLTKQGLVKLGDFGIARLMDSSMAEAKTTIGTPFYLSPEICNSEGYNLKSDLWSLGVVTYELTVLRVPFGGFSLPAVALQIMSADPDPLPKEFSADLNWIIFRFLEKEPAKRPNLDQVLRMPFVQGYIQVLLSHSKHSGAGGCETLTAQCSSGIAPEASRHAQPAAPLTPARRLPEGREAREHEDAHGREPKRGRSHRAREQPEPLGTAEDWEGRRGHGRHGDAYAPLEPPGPSDAAVAVERRSASDATRQAQRRAADETQRRALEAQRRAAMAEEEFRQREEAARASMANEFQRNRQAAAATRRRNMGFEVQVVVDDAYERRGGFRQVDGEQHKVEVRRRAQEEREGKDAAQWRELERARREYLEDMRLARLRMLEQQSGDAAKEASGAGDDSAGGGGSGDPWEHEEPSSARRERRPAEDDLTATEVSPSRRTGAEEVEHLEALERARRENEEDRRRLEAKYKGVRFCDEAAEAGSCDEVATDEDTAGDGPCLVPPRRNVERVVLPDTLAAVPEEAGQDPVDAELGADIRELIIPFTDKIRPKPKLSSDSRPSRRARSESALELGTSTPTGSGGSLPSAAGRGRRGGRGRGGRGRGGLASMPSLGAGEADAGSDRAMGTEPGTLPAISVPSGARHSSGPPPPAGHAPRAAPAGSRLQRASGSPAQWLRGPPPAAADVGRAAGGAPPSPPRSPAGGGAASAFSSAAAALGATIQAAAAATLESRTLSQGPPSPKGDGDVTQLQDVLAGALCCVEGRPVPDVALGQAAALDWNDTLGWGDTLQLADTLSYTAESGLGLDVGG